LKLNKTKLYKITSIVAAVLVVLYLGISAYAASRAMVIPRLPLVYPASSLGLAYEDVSFQTSGDGITLKGWFLPGASSRVIAIVHGGFQNRIDDNVDTPELARALVGRGYNVLLFDLRGRGESEGKAITLSYIDEDIGGAVDYLKSRGFATQDICIMGFCSGATMACIYGSRNEVGALILDGCFIDGATMVGRQAESINLPGWLADFFLPGGMLFTRVLYGYHRIDPIDVMPEIACPILFIHEERDEFTTMPETMRMFEASQNPANEAWEAGGSLHSQGFRDHPQEYIDKVDGFLKKLQSP